MTWLAGLSHEPFHIYGETLEIRLMMDSKLKVRSDEFSLRLFELVYSPTVGGILPGLAIGGLLGLACFEFYDCIKNKTSTAQRQN